MKSYFLIPLLIVLLFLLIWALGGGFPSESDPVANHSSLRTTTQQGENSIRQEPGTADQVTRREGLNSTNKTVELLLWDKHGDVELVWSPEKDSAKVMVGEGVILHGSNEQLSLEIPLSYSGSVVLEIKCEGFSSREISTDSTDIERAEGPLFVGLWPIRKVKFKVTGEESVFQTPCSIDLVDGFEANSIEDIQFLLPESREFDAVFEERSASVHRVIRFESESVGLYEWSIPGDFSKEHMVLELPDVVNFDVLCRGSSATNPIRLQIQRVISKGHSLEVKEKTCLTEHPERYWGFAGSHLLIGTDSVGNRAQKEIRLEQTETGACQTFVLDFELDQVATHQQKPPVSVNIVTPAGTVKFVLNCPDGVEQPLRCDIRLWQFSPSRHRKDLCSLTDSPDSFHRGEPIEFPFKGRTQRNRGLAQFGLEVVVPGVKQGGLALVEVPYDSEVLDFGVIELFVPGEIRLFVNGLPDLEKYSIAMAPTSLVSVKAENAQDFYGVFDPEGRCFRFKDIVAGDYQVGAFREGQLASSSQVYVPPPQSGEVGDLLCELSPPGVLTIIASNENEPFVEFKLSQINPGFWPLNYVQPIHPVETRTNFFCPAGEDLVVQVYAQLIAGNRLSPFLLVPLTLSPNGHSEINLADPPGGVVEGNVVVDNVEFPFLVAVGSNLRPYTFIEDDGNFRLAGCEQHEIELFLLDRKFQKWPLASFDFNLHRGSLLPNGAILPAE
jgi:hypothetical protein